MRALILIPTVLLLLSACNGNEQAYDASGTFEATETIVSAEASGIIKAFDIEEGESLKAGQAVGYVDSLQLQLKREQLEAQIHAILGKRPDVSTQTAALQARLKQAVHEQQRLTRLVRADAATPKQLDDASAQIVILQKQIEAQRSTLNLTSSSLDKEVLPLSVQIRQLNDQLAKCQIINPINGTVLTKYAEANEMTATGKPLYKIADLSTITLRAYVTGDQFSAIKLHQTVQVLVDDKAGKTKRYHGVVEWINNKAEFTPKTIQTKDERANLVYAVKVRVNNDGTLKIGMYGEVNLVPQRDSVTASKG